MSKPRAYTVEEARTRYLKHVRHLAEYWSQVPNKTPLEMCEGVVFSMLVVFDGGSGGHPAIDLVLRPHPDDKAFLQGEGENWTEDGTVINADDQLHERFYHA